MSVIRILPKTDEQVLRAKVCMYFHAVHSCYTREPQGFKTLMRLGKPRPSIFVFVEYLR